MPDAPASAFAAAASAQTSVETPAETSAADAPIPERFEDAVAELERLVGAMESGQMPLDALLASHRRGGVLLARCRARLQAVERQVRVLDGDALRDGPAA